MSRQSIRAALCALTTAAATVAILPLAGTAAADPGVPQAPVPVFTEGFEHNQGSASILVTDYVGSPPISPTYTADPAYLTACSGLITSQLNGPVEPLGAGCGGFWEASKQLSDALGEFAGDPDTNHGVIGYTHANPGANKVQLETVDPIPLSGPARYLTIAFDGSALGCFGAHPFWTFSLLDGTNVHPAFSGPVDPCDDATGSISGVAVGHYVGDSATLFTGASAGIRLVNGQGDSFGNDAGFDNIQILDVTPQLDKEFSVESAEINTPVTLTFTVTNTTELAAKNGWSFTDDLPGGLAVVNPGSASTTCANGDVSPTAGSVTVTGDLAAGQAACTATVQVSAPTAGSYQNCAANIVERLGVKLPGCATVQFTPPTLVFDAHAHGGRVTSPLINVPPLAPADLDCTIEPRTDTGNLATVTLPTLGTLGVINTSASGEVDEDLLRTARAQASTARVRLLGGVVTADEVVARAEAGDDLSGVVSTSGSVTLTNLRVAGVPIAVNPAPNTTISIPLVGSVVVNEQTPLAGGRGIAVNALHITLLSGIHIIVSHADVVLLRPSDPCPV